MTNSITADIIKGHRHAQWKERGENNKNRKIERWKERKENKAKKKNQE